MLHGGEGFATLHLEAIEREFGAFKALDGVSLDIRRGEFVALLGPSGCGKSTALNCIAGLLPLTDGSIRLDDKRIDHLKPEERGFGMVFQNYALFPHMTVRNNIGFGLRMRGVAKAGAQRRIDEAVALVRLQDHQHKLPGQLSGGQQQRVAIARAIVVEPLLVLMDEPLSNLDAKLRLEMRQEIRRIHAQLGTTTIYVTHDQEEALSLADRVVVMRDGRVQQVGTPAELFDAPVDLEVADFMGFRNRLSARMLASDAGGVTVSVGPAGAHAGQLAGRARHADLGQDVVIAIRPDDLSPRPAGQPGLQVTVDHVEYQGRGFQALGRTTDGQTAYFRSDRLLRSGEVLTLAADPGRALVYAARPSGAAIAPIAAIAAGAAGRP
jgi:putative spermidine/putrescine transport system ATP-binding protein